MQWCFSRHLLVLLSKAYCIKISHTPFVLHSIERFHSSGQRLCKFIETKESSFIRKRFNFHSTNMAAVSLFWNVKRARSGVPQLKENCTECKYGGPLGRPGSSCAKARLMRPQEFCFDCVSQRYLISPKQRTCSRATKIDSGRIDGKYSNDSRLSLRKQPAFATPPLVSRKIDV